MAALAEFASRPRRQDFAADEVAAAFRPSWMSAAGDIEYARTVARRLPVTFAALAAGNLDPVHVKIIEDVTSVLSDEDAALADEFLATAVPASARWSPSPCRTPRWTATPARPARSTGSDSSITPTPGTCWPLRPGTTPPGGA